jgi:hypothetical protein
MNLAACSHKELRDIIDEKNKQLHIEMQKVRTLKTILEGIYNLKDKKVEQPIYTLNPSFQQMKAIAAAIEIDETGMLIELDAHLIRHNNFGVNKDVSHT